MSATDVGGFKALVAVALVALADLVVVVDTLLDVVFGSPSKDLASLIFSTSVVDMT